MAHHVPSYSCSRRQRYQVSQLPLLSHPPANKSTKTEHNCQDSGVVATQVHLLVEPVRCHTIYHFISAFVDSSISTAAPRAHVGFFVALRQYKCSSHIERWLIRWGRSTYRIISLCFDARLPGCLILHVRPFIFQPSMLAIPTVSGVGCRP